MRKARYIWPLHKTRCRHPRHPYKGMHRKKRGGTTSTLAMYAPFFIFFSYLIRAEVKER